MANFQLFFSIQGTGGSPTGPDPENRVGDQDIGRAGRPVSSGLQVPGEPGALSCKNKTPLVNLPRRFPYVLSRTTPDVDATFCRLSVSLYLLSEAKTTVKGFS